MFIAACVLAALGAFVLWALMPTQARWEEEDRRRRAFNDALAKEMIREYREALAKRAR